VVIPCYNHANFLQDSIRSVLAQTYPNLDILVVDDGSTDNTREVVSQFPSVRYLYQENAGVGAARNNGWRHTQGEFLQFLDADDYLLPTKIQRCVELFMADPAASVVYTDYETRTEDMCAPHPHQHPAWEMPEGHVLKRLVEQNTSFFVPACALIRREYVEQVNGFNETLLGTEDWFLWVSLAAYGAKFRYLPETLAWYRHTMTGLSKQEVPLAYARLRAYEDLRLLPIPENLINLDDKLADRHHVMAIKLWQHGQPAKARQHLKKAVHLQRKGRISRCLLWGFSYITTLEVAERLIKKLKRQRL
jgi:glycosyltransferase involved in cell wall biosynthesis